MKKILLLLVLLVLASSMVFAAGGKENATAALRWSYWGSEPRIKAVQQAVDEYFNRTGVLVAAEVAVGTTEHFNKVLTQIAGGNAPDIVQLGGYFSNLNLDDNNRTAPGVENILLPLDDYIKRGIIETSKIDPAAIQAGTRGGKVYAISVAYNMPALVYNKALLQRIGAPLPNVSMTWTEFETWMRAVKARLPANTYVFTDQSATESGSSFFGYWAGQNGTPQYDGTKTSLTAAIVQQYFDMWARWRTEGLVPPAATSADYAESNEASSAMIAGRTVVQQIWSNQLPNFQNATRDELDLIELPNAAVSNGLWTQNSQMISVNKNSKNPEAAVRFINYFLTDPKSVGFMLSQYGTPATPAGRAAVASSADANTRKTLAYLDVAGKHTSQANPNMPNDTEYNSGLHLIAQNVAYGRITTAAGGQQVMDLINRLIAAAR
jgi:multiple sugar transport system substrate-binding protein